MTSPTIPPASVSAPDASSSVSSPTTTPKTLISQGAEALIYRTTFLTPSLPALLKHRPPKPYRHPILDQRLTRHRCVSEARLLVRARALGIPVPAVYFVAEARGEIYMEWIEGRSVRSVLDEILRRGEEGRRVVDRMMVRLGQAVGRLHMADVVHGDLTTSNVMVRSGGEGERLLSGWPEGAEDRDVVGRGDGEQETLGEGEIVLIDFGLGAISTAEEDKAVDLYVLERAFLSTHPKAEELFKDVLVAYEGTSKEAKKVLRRLQDVRMRGRKRSMIG